MIWERFSLNMSNIVAILFISTCLFADSLASFEYIHTFSLKKDEVATISVIKKDYKTTSPKSGKMFFRWTLFHNDLLILLVNYEGFSTQYVLKNEQRRDSVNINLLGDYERVNQRVFMIIKFSEFNESKKVASINVMIFDSKKRVEVKFTDPKI